MNREKLSMRLGPVGPYGKEYPGLWTETGDALISGVRELRISQNGAGPAVLTVDLMMAHMDDVVARVAEAHEICGVCRKPINPDGEPNQWIGKLVKVTFESPRAGFVRGGQTKLLDLDADQVIPYVQEMAINLAWRVGEIHLRFLQLHPVFEGDRLCGFAMHPGECENKHWARREALDEIVRDAGEAGEYS